MTITEFKRYKPLIVLSLLVGILGWFESRPIVIQFLDAQSPFVIFALWYVVMGAFLFALGKTLFHKRTKHNHIFAIMIMYFAVNIIAYWPASNFVNEITKKQASNILLATEDGAVFSIYQGLGIPIEINAILTYVVTPIALFAVAFFMMTPARFKQALEIVFT